LTVLDVPRVVSKIKLTQVAVQVLLSDMMIYTVKTPLENRKISFDSVRADKNITLFAGVDLSAMANDAVLVSLSESTVAGMIVGHYVRVCPYIFADDFFESFASHHFSVKGTDVPAALY
jgi:hypothetical protein